MHADSTSAHFKHHADVGYPAIHLIGETSRALAFNNVYDSLAPTALNTFRSRRPLCLLLVLCSCGGWAVASGLLLWNLLPLEVACAHAALRPIRGSAVGRRLVMACRAGI